MLLHFYLNRVERCRAAIYVNQDCAPGELDFRYTFFAMASHSWNEKGRVWEDDHGLLDEAQIARCIRADETEFKSPVPTRMISNGEYMPTL